LDSIVFTEAKDEIELRRADEGEHAYGNRRVLIREFVMMMMQKVTPFGLMAQYILTFDCAEDECVPYTTSDYQS
jgi:hypothetical protein